MKDETFEGLETRAKVRELWNWGPTSSHRVGNEGLEPPTFRM